RFRLLQFEEKLKQIETYQKENRNLLEISDIGNHSAVALLKNQLNGLQQTLTLLSEKYLERHPRIIEEKSKISVTEAELEKAIGQAIAELKTREAEARQAL